MDTGPGKSAMPGSLAQLRRLVAEPESFAREVATEKIVADRKVYRQGVERYKEKLSKGEGLGVIVVVKHPRHDLYAVLDGHHRFWAQKESGRPFIRCSVIPDFFGVGFHTTKEGFWQPSPAFTEYVRVPLIKWEKGLVESMNRFMDDPARMLREGPDWED